MRRRTTMRRIPAAAFALAGLSIAFAGASLAPSAPAEEQPRPDVFEQVWQTVQTRFFDPDFNGVDWRAMREAYRPRAEGAGSRAELAAVINAMLAEIGTSHTRFYGPDEPAYFQLLGVFLPGNEKLGRELRTHAPDVEPAYSGIGIFTEEIEGETFVRAVLDGGPADKAGLKAGDRLLAVDGRPFHPMNSFDGKAGRPTRLMVQPTPEPDSRREIEVTPKRLDTTTMFLDAMKASVRVIEREARRIGYLRIWSYAGEQYQEQLEQELLFGRLKDADALVLDLRDGWGGAWPGYLNIYTPRTLSITSIRRNRSRATFSSGWNKPVVLLVNEGTRSGKELLAYGFRKHGIGPVVGATTAGAVVQGYLSVMKDGSLLYLAVGDVLVDGEVRLEGVGVTPDIEVPFSLPYAQGADPQKERAISLARELAERPD